MSPARTSQVDLARHNKILGDKIQELEIEISKLQSAQSELAWANKELNDQKNTLTGHTAGKIIDPDRTYYDLQNEISLLAKEKDQLHHMLSQTKNMLTNGNENIFKLESQLEIYQHNIQELQFAVANSNTLIKELQGTKQIVEGDQLDTSELKNIQFLKLEIANHIDTQNQLRQDLNSLKTDQVLEITKLEERLTHRNKQLDELRKIIADLEERCQVEVESLLEKIRILEEDR